MKVHFFFGEQGSGKTTLRKQIQAELGGLKAKVIEKPMTNRKIRNLLNKQVDEVVFIESQLVDCLSFTNDVCFHSNLTRYNCRSVLNNIVEWDDLPF